MNMYVYLYHLYVCLSVFPWVGRLEWFTGCGPDSHTNRRSKNLVIVHSMMLSESGCLGWSSIYAGKLALTSDKEWTV